MKSLTRILTTVAMLAAATLFWIPTAAYAQTPAISFYQSVNLYGPNQVVTQLGFGAPLEYVAAPTQTVVVQNTGTATASTVVVGSSSGNTGDFTYVTAPVTNCGGSLAVGATCTITITFTPAGTGARTTHLQVSGSNFTTAYITLTGNGTAWIPSPHVTAYYSDTSTGTTANSVATWTTSNCPNSLSICLTTPATSATSGIAGVVVSGAGKGVLTTIATTGGIVTALADNTVTVNHYLTYGSTTGGAIKDAGATPSTNLIGLALGSASAAGTFPMLIGYGSPTLSFNLATLTAPTVNQPIVTLGNTAVAATLSPTCAAQSGQQILIGATGGEVVTLPVPVVGCNFHFIISVSNTSNYNEIETSSGSVFLLGDVHHSASGIASLDFWANGTSTEAIKMDGAHLGGLLGSDFWVTAISTTVWQISGNNLCTATCTTAFTGTP